MHNIIQIRKEYFIELHKLLVICVDDVDVKKVKDMLANYACFNEDVGAFHQKFVYKQGFKVPHNTNIIKTKTRRIVSYQEKIQRETVAILNKINDSNFGVLCEKLLKLCDENSLETVVSMILKKCYMQEYYLHIYIKVFEMIHQKYDAKLLTFFNKFVGMIQEEIDNDLNSIVQNDVDDYNNYCDFVMKKKVLVQKHKTLMHLYKRNWVNLNIDMFFRKLVNLIETNTNTVMLDVLITICYEVAKVEPVLFLKMLNTTTLDQHNMNTKTKFLLSDIYAIDKKFDTYKKK